MSNRLPFAPYTQSLRDVFASRGGSISVKPNGHGVKYTFRVWGLKRDLAVPDQSINPADRAFFVLPPGATEWLDCPAPDVLRSDIDDAAVRRFMLQT